MGPPIAPIIWPKAKLGSHGVSWLLKVAEESPPKIPTRSYHVSHLKKKTHRSNRSQVHSPVHSPRTPPRLQVACQRLVAQGQTKDFHCSSQHCSTGAVQGGHTLVRHGLHRPRPQHGMQLRWNMGWKNAFEQMRASLNVVKEFVIVHIVYDCK